MDILELALKARIPLIRVYTEDTLNAPSVLSFLVGGEVQVLKDKDITNTTSHIYHIATDINDDIEELYTYLVESEKVLVLLNSSVESPLIFEAGTLPTPIAMVREHLEQIATPELVDTLLPVFGGLNLKEIAEVSRITMAHYGALIPRDVLTIRRRLTESLQGLQQVDTMMDFYTPNDSLKSWVEHNKSIFLQCTERRIVPRGLLFSGEPGTGKTQGAKYIAEALGIPLYFLDIGGTMAKYVGQSEGNLSRNLLQIEQAEPCVVLLDEIEKVFKTSDDSGVTTRLLSKLLWWLQEHKARVLTIMTTNDVSAIPQELYRERRIDTIFEFTALERDKAIEFAKQVIASFPKNSILDRKTMILKVIRSIQQSEASTFSHAAVTQLVYNFIKEHYVLTN